MPHLNISIQCFRTRKEIAQILGISERSLYNLITSKFPASKIPRRGRLSPYHQRLIFDHVGIPVVFQDANEKVISNNRK